MPFVNERESTPCTFCRSRGRVPGGRCPHCQGRGTIERVVRRYLPEVPEVLVGETADIIVIEDVGAGWVTAGYANAHWHEARQTVIAGRGNTFSFTARTTGGNIHTVRYAVDFTLSRADVGPSIPPKHNYDDEDW